jgi:hypothetical protein
MTLQELANSGAKIKVNSRLHARFLVAYSKQLAKERDGNEWMNGLLLIGSFDFNKDCIGLDRHDAGILTKYPDLSSRPFSYLTRYGMKQVRSICQVEMHKHDKHKSYSCERERK